MTTLKDIAEKCQVSVSTVSLAINKPHKISLEQKDKILKAAHELGYFRVKKRSINRVLLVVDNFHATYYGDFYSNVIFGILDSLYKENIAIQILGSFNVEYSEIYENDGIVFAGKVPDSFIEKAKGFRMPFVLCGHPSKSPEDFYLRFNIEQGIEELLDYVISCGHQKIGVIIGDQGKDDPIYIAKMNSFKKFLAKENISWSNELLATCRHDNLQTVEIALNKLWKLKPSVIFCGDDHIAYMAYQILKKWQVNVPEDISIVGFDGVTIPSHLEKPQPVLTTILSDQVALGREGISALKEIIKNPGIKERKRILPVTLKIGDSVKRII